MRTNSEREKAHRHRYKLKRAVETKKMMIRNNMESKIKINWMVKKLIQIQLINFKSNKIVANTTCNNNNESIK